MAHDPNDPQQAEEAWRHYEYLKDSMNRDNKEWAKKYIMGNWDVGGDSYLGINRTVGMKTECADNSPPQEKSTESLFRWEAFDFVKYEVHVSCPKCFTLTRTPFPTNAFYSEIMPKCSCCHFTAPMEANAEAEAQLKSRLESQYPLKADVTEFDGDKIVRDIDRPKCKCGRMLCICGFDPAAITPKSGTAISGIRGPYIQGGAIG